MTRGSITTADGTTIAYSWAGSGPAIVLHPGVSMPGASFPPVLVDALTQAGHTVVAIDPRDTGGSTRYEGPAIDLGAVMGGDAGAAPYTFHDMAGDALAVLDSLGIRSATWVGHSMGGSVIAAVGAIAPERVEGMVFFSSAPGFGAGPTPEFLELVLREVPTDRDAAVAWRIDVSRWAMGRHWDDVSGTVRAEWFVDDLGWWGIPTAHLAAFLVGLPDVTSLTPDEQATLLIFGDEDDMTAGGREMAATLPDAITIELEGYAHWFPEPGPWPEIAQAILRVTPPG